MVAFHVAFRIDVCLRICGWPEAEVWQKAQWIAMKDRLFVSFFWWMERSLVCVLWGQLDWKLSCWLDTVGVHVPLLLFLWIQKRILLYFVCVFRVRQGCNCKGSPCWELHLFLSAGCRNTYSYLCKIWAFVSKVFLQWNLPCFFDVICIWSQFPFRSRASELSYKEKKKNTKQDGGRDICQRRYNMKGGGNIELRTSDLLGSRSSYAKGLWVGCPASGPQWRWTVPSVSTWVTCPSSLRVGVWVWGRHLTWLLMLSFIGFKASSFQVQVSSS